MIWLSKEVCAWCTITGTSDRARFEKYRRRFSPYCSVASLYLWVVAGGAIEGMKDYAPSKSVGKKKQPAAASHENAARDRL